MFRGAGAWLPTLLNGGAVAGLLFDMEQTIPMLSSALDYFSPEAFVSESTASWIDAINRNNKQNLTALERLSSR